MGTFCVFTGKRKEGAKKERRSMEKKGGGNRVFAKYAYLSPVGKKENLLGKRIFIRHGEAQDW